MELKGGTIRRDGTIPSCIKPKGLRERSQKAAKLVCWKVRSGFGPHFLLQNANKGSCEPYWLSKRLFGPYFPQNLCFCENFSYFQKISQQKHEFSPHDTWIFQIFAYLTALWVFSVECHYIRDQTPKFSSSSRNAKAAFWPLF